jgi:hypothetical protein
VEIAKKMKSWWWATACKRHGRDPKWRQYCLFRKCFL